MECVENGGGLGDTVLSFHMLVGTYLHVVEDPLSYRQLRSPK